jgi:hypothetical protein
MLALFFVLSFPPWALDHDAGDLKTQLARLYAEYRNGGVTQATIRQVIDHHLGADYSANLTEVSEILAQPIVSPGHNITTAIKLTHRLCQWGIPKEALRQCSPFKAPAAPEIEIPKKYTYEKETPSCSGLLSPIRLESDVKGRGIPLVSSNEYGRQVVRRLLKDYRISRDEVSGVLAARAHLTCL